MSPSATAAVNSTSQRIDSAAGFIINCSFSGCAAKIDGNRHALCEAHKHLEDISNTDQSRDSVQANGTRPAQAPAGTSGFPSQSLFSTSNPRKMLPETDKDRPIMRRKTAGNPGQFIAQQPTPKHSTPPSRGESIMSPPSSRPLAPRPPVHSPPASPGSLGDGERTRKRQRLSPSPGRSPKARANRTMPSRPPTADSSSRRASKHSSQPGRAREKDAKAASKPSFRHAVRRVPLQLSNLQFIDIPGDRASGVLSEQSSSGVNGSAGHVPRRSSGGSELSLNGDVKDYFGRKTSSAASSATLTGSIDSSGQARRLSELSNGQSQKAPPDRTRPDAQTGYGPFQANGITASKPPPQKIHFPIRPAQITKTQPVQLPKTKEIDTSKFDALIYSQPGAASPPPDVDLTTTTAPPKPTTTSTTTTTTTTTSTSPEKEPPQPPKEEEDEPLYLDIDPRIHWPQPHSPAWHAAKRQEIQTRGNKKANFGRAARSLRRQQQQQREGDQQGVVALEDSLPEKMAENPAWVRALRRLRGLPPLSSSAAAASSAASSCQGEDHGSVGGGGSSINGSGVERKGRKPPGVGGATGVTGKRLGNSGVVVVSGLNGAQMMGGMRRVGGDGS
ncbi:hypothetical protein C8A01DRAFT_13707 [Parachaetomium inaequale]|uniref:Uncharacterized protein n=1 Tax=Parachaetomium inaequale TaxID=2588326 RepID=A0AAN6PKI8_9PEZI|nr:hypothetical protein C8A01DRAFT_13707 [Parachaetomium inaequale]